MSVQNQTKKELNGNDLLLLASKEMPNLVDPILPQGCLATLVGESEVGKSCFLLQLALSIVQGKGTFLNLPLNTKHNRVIYYSTEDGAWQVGKRIAKQLGVEEELNPDDPPRFDYLENFQPNFELPDSGKLYEVIEAKLSANNADCVIIDAFSDCFSGDMNSSEVRRYLNNFKELAHKYEVLVLFLHHFSKSGKRAHKDSILGSQSYEAKNRVVLSLHHSKDSPNERDLKILKHNYLDPKEKKDYRLGFEDNLQFVHYATLDKSHKAKAASSTKHSQTTIPEKILKNHSDLVKKTVTDKKYTYKKAIAEIQKRDPKFKFSEGSFSEAVKLFREKNK